MGVVSDNIENQWYSQPGWLLFLAPLATLFSALTYLRRYYYRRKSPPPLPVPIVIVGNIAVGGTGKTPLIIALVKHLKAQGYTPGIISRGYGVDLTQSLLVNEQSLSSEVGDEPLLIARITGCPVAVGPRRLESVKLLTANSQCDVVLSDDGLQHYALPRDLEIAVLDADRRLGNGWRLPVGPLRESANRLHEVDFVLVNGAMFSASWLPRSKSWSMSLSPVNWRNVKTGQIVALDALGIQQAKAVAGVGNPQRFLRTLKSLGFDGEFRFFPDHYSFSLSDFNFAEVNSTNEIVLMTEKDAVKCDAFAQENWWALCVEIALDKQFLEQFISKLSSIQSVKLAI